jgi:cell division protein FtsW
MNAGHGSAFFMLRQLTGVLAGVFVFAVVSKVDAERLQKWAWPLMWIALLSMLLVILPFTERIAPRVLGARRYLFASSFQPSEFAKLAVVVWTSMLLIKKGDNLRRLSKGLLPFLVVVGALDVLAWLEPDLSTAMFFTLIMAVILYAGGVRIGHFVALGVLAIPIGWEKAKDMQYIVLRMVAFLNPGVAGSERVGHQLKQSLIAVGSGGWFGRGFGQGFQQYGFLPLAYNDFIAGNIGEEWGFLGITFTIVAYGIYGWLGFRIAKQARSRFLQLVAVGLTMTIVITAYLHIGVVIGLLPTTGLTLPFISYGRSNLLLSILMTAILVNIGSERQRVFGDAATDPLSLGAS